MEFALPQTTVDLLPFLSACITVLLGLFALLMPRTVLRLLGLNPPAGRLAISTEVRAMLGGFPLGVGLCGVFFFDQPVAELILGAAWLFAAGGRLLSLIFDRMLIPRTLLMMIISLVLAAMPLAVALGFVSY
ncbi:DUF4345 family protein [Mangrovicella endophytica]|uniref:AGROH133_08824 family phage infection protein n=1 Tax=Mangrovicella endophytica TaxID=2066697 RepID=UPI000C9E5BB2|nr:DUF4345 family protein [Mangrovicella endophytica]